MRQKLVGALLCLWVGVAQANEDGLVGFVIGMPLGAVGGGWLGVSIIGGPIGGLAGGTIGAFAGGSIGGGLGGLLGDKIRDARGGRIGPKWLMGTMLSGGVGGLLGATIMGGPTGVLVGGSAGVLIGGTILHFFVSGRPWKEDQLWWEGDKIKAEWQAEKAEADKIKADKESGLYGETAYAIPLSAITIDGKLDDWPQQMAIYPIDWISSLYKPTPPEGPDDLTASFRVGYDLEANLLYLAIVVQDEDLVIHPETPAFSNQDLCEVYVDADHSGGDVTGGAQQYVMVAGPGKFARDVDGNPALNRGNTQTSGVQAAVLRLGQTIAYEWAIPLFESFPERRFQIELGKTIGFDVAVVDADGRENGNWVAWTPGSGKVFNSDRFGDLLFVQDYDDLGRSVGRVVKEK